MTKKRKKKKNSSVSRMGGESLGMPVVNISPFIGDQRLSPGSRHSLSMDVIPDSLARTGPVRVTYGLPGEDTFFDARVVAYGEGSVELAVDRELLSGEARVAGGRHLVRFVDTYLRGSITRGSQVHVPEKYVPRSLLNVPFVAKITSAGGNPRYFNAQARSNRGKAVLSLGEEHIVC